MHDSQIRFQSTSNYYGTHTGFTGDEICTVVSALTSALGNGVPLFDIAADTCPESTV